jgi:hypothetical protein
MGVHCAVQPPETSALHVALAETLICPQSAMPALAFPASVARAKGRANAARRKEESDGMMKSSEG